MKVAYVFSTSGHTASYKLGKMILPQLEEGRHGAEVIGNGGMFPEVFRYLKPENALEFIDNSRHSAP